MKTLLITASLLAMYVATPAVAVDAPTTTTAPAMECCNTACPVCDMAVDPKVGSANFKPSETVKAKNPGIESAKVGFCSDKCKAAFEKEPAKYEDKIVPQWLQNKNKQGKAKAS